MAVLALLESEGKAGEHKVGDVPSTKVGGPLPSVLERDASVPPGMMPVRTLSRAHS